MQWNVAVKDPQMKTGRRFLMSFFGELDQKDKVLPRHGYPTKHPLNRKEHIEQKRSAATCSVHQNVHSKETNSNAE